MAQTPVFFFFFFFLLAVTGLKCGLSARLLDEVDFESQPLVVVSPPLATIPSPATFPAPQVGQGTAPSSGSQIPTTTPSLATSGDDDDDSPIPGTNAPVAGSGLEDEEDDATATAPVAVAPVVGGSSTGSVPATVVGATATQQGPQSQQSTEPFSFFMHDILGGSNPTARVVTGIVANTDDNGIAFSKPYDNFFPVEGGVPLLNDNLQNIINNNNNLPFLAGFNGASQGGNLLLQNSANSGNLNGDGDNQPFVTAGQLPSRVTLQQLMFGSVTVIDDELTEGHELGSAVIGRAQGFYMASSLDGTSQTVALTALFHGSGHEHEFQDTISFFGVHRTATPVSHIAVIGGTGKYENAKGYATVETLHHQENQHTTDGEDTIVHFSVYLSAE